YVKKPFWRCPKRTCQNYYQHDLKSCPVCKPKRGRGRGAAPSGVWVLGPRVIVQRDQYKGWEERDLRVSASLTGTFTGADAGRHEDEETRLKRLDVRAAVEQLPSDLHEIITMCYDDGMTEDEIADELQRPLEEIQDAIQEAHKQLGALLGPGLGHIDN